MHSNQSEVLSASQATSVLYHLEPLNLWLSDPSITEVCVNRPNEVFFERAGKWERAECAIDLNHLRALGTAVACFCGGERELSDIKPIMSAVLPGGERAQFVTSPACEHNTVSLTIRKPAQTVRSLESYEAEGFFSHVRPLSQALTEGENQLLSLKEAGQYMAFLREAVAQNKVIVIAGETGSGKTTLMRSLVQEIPAEQRLITIEDVPELTLDKHPNHVHLYYQSEAKEDDAVTSASLLKSCLRMKPDRILLAELRGGETFDFVNVCASGHGGSITSCHAGSAALTFERLALMILQNRQGRTLPYEVIRKLLYLVVDVVVHVHNDGRNGRHITEVWFEPSRKRELA